ncbi:MAG: tRNA (pseudouridine(54)-N(1))-methyltransferase TrmY [Candidatus Aenigmarchaeota archaeon]|nr:tRNA (pseudouridine(54)-N(1))-methyltransferase TrmY [Candidatus Aenigmarchaeota archaeon]
MTRTFILYSYGTTDDFNLDRLFESGRIDLVCRCVIGALWISNDVRRDTQIIIVLNTGRRPPVSIKFDGNKILGIEASELSIAQVIKKALSVVKDKEWANVQSGVSVSRRSFQEIVKDAKNVYVLDAKGKHISNFKPENPTFVLGDNVGLPKNEMSFALRKGEKVSLGNKVYLASSVVSVVNWILDQ